MQWRRNDEIGLAFPEPERKDDAGPSTAEITERVAMLEAETASLRTLLKRRNAENDDSDEAAA